jgi:hypothetical protein
MAPPATLCALLGIADKALTMMEFDESKRAMMTRRPISQQKTFSKTKVCKEMLKEGVYSSIRFTALSSLQLSDTQV